MLASPLPPTIFDNISVEPPLRKSQWNCGWNMLPFVRSASWYWKSSRIHLDLQLERPVMLSAPKFDCTRQRMKYSLRRWTFAFRHLLNKLLAFRLTSTRSQYTLPMNLKASHRVLDIKDAHLQESNVTSVSDNWLRRVVSFGPMEELVWYWDKNRKAYRKPVPIQVVTGLTDSDFKGGC